MCWRWFCSGPGGSNSFPVASVGLDVDRLIVTRRVRRGGRSRVMGTVGGRLRLQTAKQYPNCGLSDSRGELF